MTIEVEILRRARTLIEEPQLWLQGGSSMTISLPNGEHATSRCSAQAVREASEGASDGMVKWRAMGELDALAMEQGYENIQDLNDSPRITHKDILKIFDRAIQKLETAV